MENSEKEEEKTSVKSFVQENILYIIITVLLVLLIINMIRASNYAAKYHNLNGQLANMKDQNAGLLRLHSENAFNFGKLAARKKY